MYSCTASDSASDIHFVSSCSDINLAPFLCASMFPALNAMRFLDRLSSILFGDTAESTRAALAFRKTLVSSRCLRNAALKARLCAVVLLLLGEGFMTQQTSFFTLFTGCWGLVLIDDTSFFTTFTGCWGLGLMGNEHVVVGVLRLTPVVFSAALSVAAWASTFDLRSIHSCVLFSFVARS